jgi:hypothetical protein
MSDFPYKLGLKKHVALPGDIYLKNYRLKAPSPLPQHPDTFGHYGLIGDNDWGMLGNDRYGDCAVAGPSHETMLANKIRGVDMPFNDACVLQTYGEITGFDPATGANDNGTDMRALAEYRMNTGILDANGNRHKILAYAWLTPGDSNGLSEAMWLFDGMVGIGIQVPQLAMDQFQQNFPWDLSPTGEGDIEGGHYIPGMGDDGNIQTVTWSRRQPMTKRFYAKYNDATLVYVTDEMLVNGKTPENFDLQALIADCQYFSQNQHYGK